MAKLSDPDSLDVAVNATATTQEVEIQTAAKTIELRLAGSLNDDSPGLDSGVTGKCLYSFLKEEWLANSVLRRHRFPIQMIFEGSFIMINGWTFQGDQSEDLIRDSGFQVQATQKEKACIVSLGSMVDSGADQGYYQQAAGFSQTVVQFDKTGEVNENIEIVGSGGTPDNTAYLKLHLREQGKLYAEYDLINEQGLAGLTYQAYRLPLANSTDIKIAETDGNIDTLTPYTNMKVNYLKGNGFTTAAATTYTADDVVQDGTGRWAFCTTGGTVTTPGGAYASFGGTSVWEAYDGEELIGSTYYAFNRVISCGTTGSTVEIHEWAMRQLRKATDINADDTTSINQRGFGTVNGELAKLLTAFVGDTLKPQPGVLLRDFDANSTNDIIHSPITVDAGLDSEFVPITSSEVTFPFVAAGNFNFSQNLVDQPDVDTVYTAYHDYVTSTTDSNLAISGTAGSVSDLDWTSTTLDHLNQNDWIIISGFTEAGNNGIWEVTGVPGAQTVSITKRDGLTPVDEVLGDSVTVLQNPFNTPGAVIVTDNSSSPMDGQITAGTIAWDFDFTNNDDGGRTGNTPAPITIVAIAKNGATWVEASHTIIASTGQNVPINAADELNYENP